MPKIPSYTKIAWLLALLASLGPFSIDTYLPSFHDIERNFGASSVAVQQTLTFYFLPFAFMSLWHGAFADAFGRRKVVLMSLVIFLLGMAGSIFAQKIEHLWALRLIQGVSAGAGVVVSRAIIRDLFEGEAAQRLMSHMTMIFGLAPALAPVIGGQLQDLWGWRSVFVFLTLFSGVVLIGCFRYLPETLKPEDRQSLSARYLLCTYWQVLTSLKFLIPSLIVILNFTGFFIYVMSSPVFLMTHLKVPETQFLWLFGPAMTGLVLGAYSSGKIAGKLSLKRTLIFAYGMMGFAALLNLAISFLLPPSAPLSVLPMGFYTFGMSLIAPSLTLLALDPFPKQRGLASSCQMFVHTGVNTLTAGIIAPFLWGSVRSLALGMSVFMASALLLALMYWKHMKKRSAPKTVLQKNSN